MVKEKVRVEISANKYHEAAVILVLSTSFPIPPLVPLPDSVLVSYENNGDKEHLRRRRRYSLANFPATFGT